MLDALTHPLTRMVLTSLRRDRIEEQRISRQRLPTILRTKAEENDTADRHLYQSGFASNAITAEQPTGKKWIFVARIPGDDAWHEQLARVAAHGRDARKDSSVRTASE